MHVFSGRGGSIYQLGERFEFTQVPLLDCGGGWDWCAPEDLRCWVGDVTFEVWDGVWGAIEPLETHPRSGRVGFSRCLEGKHVRASGACFPSTLVATGERWRLEVETVVHMNPVLGSGTQHSEGKVVGSTATIEGIEGVSPGRVFAWLPSSMRGVFVGLGQMMSDVTSAIVTFDHEGVVYEPA